MAKDARKAASSVNLISVDSTVIPFSTSVQRNGLGRSNVTTRVGKEGQVVDGRTGEIMEDKKSTSTLDASSEGSSPLDSDSFSMQGDLLSNMGMSSANPGVARNVPASPAYGAASSAAARDAMYQRAQGSLAAPAGANQGRYMYGVHNSEQLESQRNSYNLGSGEVQSSATDFDPFVFKDRLLKFFKARQKMLRAAQEKGEEELEKCLKSKYKSYFTAPRVKVDFDQLLFVITDLLEFGDLDDCPAFDNLLDIKGVPPDYEEQRMRFEEQQKMAMEANRHRVAEQQRLMDVESAKHFIPDRAMRYSAEEGEDSRPLTPEDLAGPEPEDGEEINLTVRTGTPTDGKITPNSRPVQDSGGSTNFDAYFGTSSEDLPNYQRVRRTGSTKVLSADELVAGLTAKKEGVEEHSIDILKAEEFESCKKFKCPKYSLFSVGDYASITGRNPDVKTSTLFKACCDCFNKEGCPQSKVYNEGETIIYQSTLESIGDAEAAHNVILSLRLKKAGSQ